MELWIRSQDKSQLLKVIGLYYDYQHNKHHITCITENDYYWVGIYATKERTLEILDEIQNYLINNSFVKKQNGLGEIIDLIPNPLFVYEMPKE